MKIGTAILIATLVFGGFQGYKVYDQHKEAEIRREVFAVCGDSTAKASCEAEIDRLARQVQK
jgi:hypothetical protein